MLDELLAGARSEEEIVGPGGILSQLMNRLVERAMGVELVDHLRLRAPCGAAQGIGNARNDTDTEDAGHGGRACPE